MHACAAVNPPATQPAPLPPPFMRSPVRAGCRLSGGGASARLWCLWLRTQLVASCWAARQSAWHRWVGMHGSCMEASANSAKHARGSLRSHRAVHAPSCSVPCAPVAVLRPCCACHDLPRTTSCCLALPRTLQPEAALPPPFPTTKPRRTYVSNIATLPQHRRKGVASALLRQCERQARLWRRDSLWLHVELDNVAARRVGACPVPWELNLHGSTACIAWCVCQAGPSSLC